MSRSLNSSRSLNLQMHHDIDSSGFKTGRKLVSTVPNIYIYVYINIYIYIYIINIYIYIYIYIYYIYIYYIYIIYIV